MKNAWLEQSLVFRLIYNIESNLEYTLPSPFHLMYGFINHESIDILDMYNMGIKIHCFL